jgi:hypothetical protein
LENKTSLFETQNYLREDLNNINDETIYTNADNVADTTKMHININ